MAVKNGDLEEIVSLPNYNPDTLVITNGVEEVTARVGQSPRYYANRGGTEITNVIRKISCKITEERQHDQPGWYCLNIYHRGFCARDCMMGKNDLCACKQGETQK